MRLLNISGDKATIELDDRQLSILAYLLPAADNYFDLISDQLLDISESEVEALNNDFCAMYEKYVNTIIDENNMQS